MLFDGHDLCAVRQVSQRGAVIYPGRIVAEGVPDDGLYRRADPSAQALR